MPRSRHPNKDIEAAIKYAESRGWEWIRTASHGWGVFYCRHRARDGCQMTVQSTPRVPRNHADQIRKEVDNCPH
jgi:hypothetical protein